MSLSNPKYVAELNELAQLCTDSADAYRRAVEQVESADLASFCKRRAESRETIAGQLRATVDQLGETPEEGGTARGTAERVLGEVRSLVGDDEEAILSELVRIEGVLKDRFEVHLDAGTAQEVDEAIARHYRTIEDDYRELSALATGKPG